MHDGRIIRATRRRGWHGAVGGCGYAIDDFECTIYTFSRYAFDAFDTFDLVFLLSPVSRGGAGWAG